MRVTVACPGRFHVGDLARELHRLGNEIEFHSMVPRSRLASVGIPDEIQRCHLSRVWPWVIMQRFGKLGPSASEMINRKIILSLDARYAKIRNPGDVFIGMSGLCVESLKAAKSRGALIVLERGSKHILEQKRILDDLRPTANTPSLVPTWAVERELEGYEIADFIAIPARHVKESFLLHGVPAHKLIRNAYGVDLDQFSPKLSVSKEFDVIMTGAWCQRKGCDTLAEAVLGKLKGKLLHIGPVGDCPLPKDRYFTHVDAVPQKELSRYYQRARVFAMPSQEDGFGMVFAQALACGLPVVGSVASGTPDLAELLNLSHPWIQSVYPSDVDQTAAAISIALAASENPAPYLAAFAEKSEVLSWRSYGARYDEFLRSQIGRLDKI